MHRDERSRTLLHHAVSTGSKEVVRYLLDHGEPGCGAQGLGPRWEEEGLPGLSDHPSPPPAPPEILDAVEEKAPNFLPFVMALGGEGSGDGMGSIASPCSPSGETCLHQAAALGQRTICHYIVEAGASLMKTDQQEEPLPGLSQLGVGHRPLDPADRSSALLQGDTPRQRAEKAQDTELAAYLENRQHYQMIQREDQETAV
ncbi:hypothetical protein P7K49_021858 [Saguinus oedipus]|uniref:Uncharacterized protein n=1 Tax=Saguinus oedipus TaxID=9490 RepID=A0ABQ9UUN6_SAGOE|nr:hypothetical protein P7K49_021858 [Saguinus oedipus]